MTNIGRVHSAQTLRQLEQQVFIWPSSARMKFSGRRAGKIVPTVLIRPTERWFAIRKLTQTNQSTPKIHQFGRGRGEIRALARPPMVAAPRTRLAGPYFT